MKTSTVLKHTLRILNHGKNWCSGFLHTNDYGSACNIAEAKNHCLVGGVHCVKADWNDKKRALRLLDRTASPNRIIFNNKIGFESIEYNDGHASYAAVSRLIRKAIKTAVSQGK